MMTLHYTFPHLTHLQVGVELPLRADLLHRPGGELSDLPQPVPALLPVAGARLGGGAGPEEAHAGLDSEGGLPGLGLSL